MPQNPLDTLIALNEMTEGLDQAQRIVNEARTLTENQHVQLQLDRMQTQIDKRRELVSSVMLDITSRN